VKPCEHEILKYTENKGYFYFLAMANFAIILNGVQGVEGSNPFIPTRN
jgi:hypothetical protein